jgi:hypothetical protein
MNKSILILLLLCFISCKQKEEKLSLEEVLKGNTFNMTSTGEKDTLTIDFKDSTYTIFDYSYQNNPWRIVSFEQQDILVLQNRVIPITQVNDHTLKGILISEKDYEITFEKRKTSWKKEWLNGIWIEEKHYDLFFNDSIAKPPPPHPPMEGSENDFQYPPYYEIKNDTITLTYHYQVAKSKFELSNSMEFVALDLRSDFDKVEKSWKIEKLTDSIMIISRTIEKENTKSDFTLNTEEKVKLIKKS